MGHVERLFRQMEGTKSHQQAETELDQLKRDIRSTWADRKTYLNCMSDRQVSESPIDMVLYYLIRKGVLNLDD